MRTQKKLSFGFEFGFDANTHTHIQHILLNPYKMGLKLIESMFQRVLALGFKPELQPKPTTRDVLKMIKIVICNFSFRILSFSRTNIKIKNRFTPDINTMVSRFI
jgi:hypothetical protein